MNIAGPFIRRPIATTLLAIGVLLAGAWAFTLLPVSPLPRVDFPTISVSASLPGASPETMASSVATPLERRFGRIAGVTEITSTNVLGATNITLNSISTATWTRLRVTSKRRSRPRAGSCRRTCRSARRTAK